MQSFGRFFILVLLVFAMQSSPATAMQPQGTQAVTVSAIVAPARFVYVNDKLEIVKILSNTDLEVEPTFLLESQPAIRFEAPEALHDEYQAIKTNHRLLRVGDVYNVNRPKPIAAKAETKAKPYGLSNFRISLIF